MHATGTARTSPKGARVPALHTRGRFYVMGSWGWEVPLEVWDYQPFSCRVYDRG